MRRRKAPSAIACAVVTGMVVLVGGCANHLYSPPSRLLPLESARTMQPGQTSLGLDGQLANSVHGPTLAGASLRVRRNWVPGFEYSLEGGFARLITPGQDDIHRGLYTLRGGVKYGGVDWLALYGGLGGGGSAAGGFVAPDLGVILAYENPYFVPFIAGEVAASVPFAQRPLRIPYDGMPALDDPVQRAQATVYTSGRLGFRIPVALDGGGDLSLVAAMSLGYMADQSEDNAFIALAAGLHRSY